MRILILNQPFHPDVVATAQIAKDLADALVARGHAVTAIASRSIYGRKGAALPTRETVDGIDIVRVGWNVFGKGSTLGRLFDFALYYVHAALRGLFMRRFDAVVCLTTPPYIVVVGLLLRALRGPRVIYWLMDVYPDVMVAHGMLREGGLPHRVLRAIHRRVLRRVDHTIALGRCMKERLIRQGGRPERIDVVPPWSPASNAGAETPLAGAPNAYRRQWGVDDRVLVMYSGNFGLAHDVATFLDAAERLKDDDRIRFAFVGGGKRRAEVERFVRDRGLANCMLAEYQPRERLAELLAAADLHLVSMRPEWWGLVAPSKFYGIALAGRPAVFIGPAESEIGRVIEETGCGVRVDGSDVEALVGALRALASDEPTRRAMGERAVAYAHRNADRAACAGRIVALIEG